MAAGNTYEAIATATASGSTNIITFSSIPQTYTDLVLIVKADGTGQGGYQVRFNSDSAGNYSATRLYGDGTTASSDREVNKNNLTTEWGGGAYNMYITHIQNYSNTTTYKTALTRISENRYAVAMVGMWRSTAAVSTITVANGNSATNFASTATFSLYGIKAA
jgi:hypothetical protein